MANDAAWSTGWDAGEKKASKKKKDTDTGKDTDKDSDKKKRSGGKPGGALGGGNPWSILNYIPKFHSGGKVKKTGVYRLRKGEVVLTGEQQKAAGLKKGAKKKAAHKRTVVKS